MAEDNALGQRLPDRLGISARWPEVALFAALRPRPRFRDVFGPHHIVGSLPDLICRSIGRDVDKIAAD